MAIHCKPETHDLTTSHTQTSNLSYSTRDILKTSRWDGEAQGTDLPSCYLWRGTHPFTYDNWWHLHHIYRRSLITQTEIILLAGELLITRTCKYGRPTSLQTVRDPRHSKNCTLPPNRKLLAAHTSVTIHCLRSAVLDPSDQQHLLVKNIWRESALTKHQQSKKVGTSR